MSQFTTLKSRPQSSLDAAVKRTLQACALKSASHLLRETRSILPPALKVVMLRFAHIVTFLSLVVQLAGFVRTAIIAYALGVSLDVDAYNLGLIAPTFIATVFSAWLQVGFVGRYTGLLSTGQEHYAAVYRTQMTCVVVCFAFGLAIVCWAFPNQMMGLFLSDNRSGIANAASDALKLSAWMLIPLLIGDFVGLILNCHGRFLAAALAPLVNAAISVIGLWAWPNPDLNALVITLLLGGVAQLVFILAAMYFLRVSYVFDRKIAKGEVTKTLFIALPMMPAMMLASSAAAIIQFHMASVGEGAVAVFGYASRLHNSLTQVLVIGLSTVLLPHLASLWSRAEHEEIIRIFQRLTRVSVLVTGVLTVGVFLMGQEAVLTLFGRGRFDASHAADVASVWAILSLSLLPLTLGTFIAKLCQAMRQVGVLLVSGLISFVATWSVAYLGGQLESLGVIAAAAAASSTATAVFWLIWLNRYFTARAVFHDLLSASARTAAVLVLPLAGDFVLKSYMTTLPNFIELLVRGTAFVLCGAAALFVFRFQHWFLGRAVSQSR